MAASLLITSAALSTGCSEHHALVTKVPTAGLALAPIGIVHGR